MEKDTNGTLTVRVESFSYRKGYPAEEAGHGGGFIFDCRCMHNPGRYEEYKNLTGRDEPVVRFLLAQGEVQRYLDHVFGLVDMAVKKYRQRGFTNLLIGFGCTGGQHRSVYCAERTAHYIIERFPGVKVELRHREQNISECL